MRLAIMTVVLSLVLLGAGCLENPPQFWSLGQELADQKPAEEAEVDLSGRGLRELPTGLLQREGITSLDLSDNALGSLPAEIWRLRSLRTLDLSGNQLTGLPAELGQLGELRTLDVSGNQLTGLPYELGQLQNLKTFDLSGNDYSEADLDIIEVMLPPTVEIRR
ncbi:MAG: leucine-rich repeat domain-containing protein [bacterium]